MPRALHLFGLGLNPPPHGVTPYIYNIYFLSMSRALQVLLAAGANPDAQADPSAAFVLSLRLHLSLSLSYRNEYLPTYTHTYTHRVRVSVTLRVPHICVTGPPGCHSYCLIMKKLLRLI